MRVAYYVEAFWPRIGGIETFSDHFLREVAARGHEVTVLTSRDDPRLVAHERRGAVDVHRFDMVAALRSADPARLIEVRQAVRDVHRQVAPDVVHVAFPGVAGYFALQSVAGDATPLVLRSHTLWPPQDGTHTVLRRLLEAASWVTAVSGAALADLRRFHPAIADRSSVAYSGVDPPTMAPAPLPWDPPVVLAVGRLAPEKGLDVLLRASTEIDPAVRLVIVGDGPERARLQALAHELGVGRRVRWVGWVEPAGVWDHIQAATVVAVPSRQDAFPRIAVEAAHLARPVVASAVGGLVESVLDSVTGVLVPADDAGALADALRGVLHDPAAARELGGRGRTHAQSYSMQDTVAEHLDRYAGALG